MRIENNNNVGFGAYFKNNTNFKKVFTDACCQPKKELMDKFTHEYPNHEIEIIDIVSAPLENLYKVFNNTLGKGMTIKTHYSLALDTILKRITDDNKNRFLWNKDETLWTDAYKQLTNQK